MISNAQLDNEKSAYIYQVETLKDEIEEMEENLTQVQKDYREKKRVCCFYLYNQSIILHNQFRSLQNYYYSNKIRKKISLFKLLQDLI